MLSTGRAVRRSQRLLPATDRWFEWGSAGSFPPPAVNRLSDHSDLVDVADLFLATTDIARYETELGKR